MARRVRRRYIKNKRSDKMTMDELVDRIIRQEVESIYNNNQPTLPKHTQDFLMQVKRDYIDAGNDTEESEEEKMRKLAQEMSKKEMMNYVDDSNVIELEDHRNNNEMKPGVEDS